MTFGANDWGIGSVTQTEADRMVGACLDAGVNLFDTADIYSGGESEIVLGRALAARRDSVVLASKVRFRTGDGPDGVGLSKRHILSEVENSLRRLGTDRIDLYQAHAWDPATPLEETLEAMDTLVRQGKVRYIGCSNFAAWQIERSVRLAERMGTARFETVQPYYNLVGRDIEHEIVPVCRDHGLGILAMSPLGGSFLTGKYRRGRSRPSGSRRSDPATALPPIDEEKGYDVVEVLCEIAGGRGVSPAQVALNWVRSKPWVTSVIIGARTMDQLADNLNAATWDLPPAEVQRLDEVSAPSLPYPAWHFRAYGNDR